MRGDELFRAETAVSPAGGGGLPPLFSRRLPRWFVEPQLPPLPPPIHLATVVSFEFQGGYMFKNGRRVHGIYGTQQEKEPEF